MLHTEARLITKIKKGNHSAFKKLYEIHATYALQLAFALTKNHSDASDIVQEAFVKVYRHVESFDTSKAFKPWLYSIVMNEAKDYMRKNRKVTVVPIDEEHIEAKGIESPVEDLYEALDYLQPIHREVIVLKYLNGFQEKEVAEILNENLNTIKSRLYKGRRQLKMLLGEIDNEQEIY
ncbi:RNA polymerase [Pontibacillus halophilus JSM 076056 = DSM 19796]|uniref:RNA polymerase n=1 Tax=Pontibacillus halophilus JSM 076056 = DSM 19796 TaxID=1385510 RepID=A0A0A5GLD8_9BACI|nr:RNA polymerase sigma factor [Pontibacillus halophilus]KGX92003.1 RNA polymerase [Pontibacillus halophilus JSM 076056 = DSM 19796]